MPVVTVGPPSSASAYPSATTRWPSCNEPDSPSATVGRPVAFTFRTARSCRQSPPISRASYCFGSLSELETVIFEAPSTTWQFVTMTPSDRTTNPVPTPCPCPAPAWKMSVVTFTTAGRTRATTASTGSLLEGSDGTDRVLAGLVEEDGDAEPRVSEHALARTAIAARGTIKRRMREPPRYRSRG